MEAGFPGITLRQKSKQSARAPTFQDASNARPCVSRSSLFCHFLVALASARHFLLVLRHVLPGPVFFASLWSLQSFFFGTSLWSWRPCVTFSWTFVAPSWPHVALAVCRSKFSRARHPGAGSFSPHFIDLVLRSSPTRVLRPFPVFCFSSHEATAQPYLRLYFGNVRRFAAANLHFLSRNVFPSWARAGFLWQLPDSPPTRVLDMPHENPTKPNFRTVLHGTPPSSLSQLR